MAQITLLGMDPEIEREIRRMAKKKANPLTAMQESLISLSGKELQSRPMTYGLLHKPWNTAQN